MSAPETPSDLASILDAYLADFQTSVLPRTEALVTPSLAAAEAQYFRDRYPGARVISLSYGDKPYYVLIR